MVEQDAEFVTAETSDQVGRPYDAAQAIGGDAQQCVARGMSEGVVDVFEVVEVDEEHRRHTVASLRPAQRAGESLVEDGAVREAGERVGRRA